MRVLSVCLRECARRVAHAHNLADGGRAGKIQSEPLPKLRTCDVQGFHRNTLLAYRTLAGNRGEEFLPLGSAFIQKRHSHPARRGGLSLDRGPTLRTPILRRAKIVAAFQAQAELLALAAAVVVDRASQVQYQGK